MSARVGLLPPAYVCFLQSRVSFSKSRHFFPNSRTEARDPYVFRSLERSERSLLRANALKGNSAKITQLRRNLHLLQMTLHCDFFPRSGDLEGDTYIQSAGGAVLLSPPRKGL